MPTQWGQNIFKLAYLSKLLVSQITTPCRHLAKFNLTVGPEGPIGRVGPCVLFDILALSYFNF